MRILNRRSLKCIKSADFIRSADVISSLVIRYLSGSLLKRGLHTMLMQRRLGAGSLVNATFDSRCSSRTVADRIQSSRDLLIIFGESTRERERRQEFYGQAQSQINNCLKLASVPSVLGLDNHRPRDLVAVSIRGGGRGRSLAQGSCRGPNTGRFRKRTYASAATAKAETKTTRTG